MVRDRGADEVVADAEEAEEHLVAAHDLREVVDPGHLQEEPVDGRQDVPLGESGESFMKNRLFQN